MSIIINKIKSFRLTIQTYKNWNVWLLSRFGIRSRDPLITAQTRNGLVLFSPNNNEGWAILDEVWRNKLYERYFKIKPGFRVLDVGANCGLFSIYAATRGDSISVVCYEPSKASFEIVKKNISENHLENSIKAFPYGLGGEREQFTLYAPEGLPSCATLSKDSEILKLRGKKIKEEIVSIEKADHIWMSFPKYDFAKIDCEGAEYDIFDVLGNSIKNFHYLVLEYHKGAEPLLGILKNHGFKIVAREGEEIGLIYAENEYFDENRG